MKRHNSSAIFRPVLFLGGGDPIVLFDPDSRLYAGMADYTRRDVRVTVKIVADPHSSHSPWALIP